MRQNNNTILADYKTAHGMPLDAPLLSFIAWRKAGYMVKHGETSHHRVSLWAGSGGRYYKKQVTLWTAEQVEKI